MIQERIPIFEAILRMCAEAAPSAWHPRAYAERSGADPEALYNAVEWLYLEGLVEKAEGGRDRGPGITLTPLGRRVVDDRDALERLRNGEPVDQASVGGVVRRSLMGGATPVVNRLLLFANIAVFAWGAYLASKVPGLLGGYMSGFGGQEAYLKVLHAIGSVDAADVNAGQWWRLLTCTFVHGGVLHLGMNMYALYAVGGFAEQTWGRWRYLAIYLLGGWGGSCLALALTPGPLVGASGALCGVLGAEAVWVLIYGKHLPAQFAARVRSQMITNLILVAVMSALPRVSWQAHLGGAVGGAAAALVLHWQRFGPPPMRVLGVLALLPLAWGGFAAMQAWRKTPAQQQAARQQERQRQVESREEYDQLVRKPMVQAEHLYKRRVYDLIRTHPERWDADELTAARDTLREQGAKMTEILQQLRDQGEQPTEGAERLRQASLAYVRQGLAVYEGAGRFLDRQKEWADEANRRAWTKAEKAIEELEFGWADRRAEWEKLMRRR